MKPLTPVHLSPSLPSLLLLLSLMLLLLGYYFVVLVIGEVLKATPDNTPSNYFLVPLLLNIVSSAFSGVVELTTQLLRLISIHWLPCVESINWVTLTREDYCDPLHLWVIKVAGSGPSWLLCSTS